ncbi:MAG: hypothetical protein QOF16_944 [Actinomycetota bacterium]|nr:hypothetical protein [Actinomycetota bacterium]MEA2487290.1 hypothetical protein [Actinomycetota bacterium]
MRELIREMETLLEADIPRVDAVVSRLFPDAYDDADESERFRELIGDQLHDAKRAALRTVKESLGTEGKVSVTLAPENAEEWLRVLTDLRLAIGTRLEIDDAKMSADIDPGDPDAQALLLLHWLGWTQELLVEAIDR